MARTKISYGEDFIFSDFIWRGPLATSSLAVGRFAAKKGSLRSPRGRLVASLGKMAKCSYHKVPMLTLVTSRFSRLLLLNFQSVTTFG